MKGREQDLHLSMGYFRMQQDVFTCRFLLHNDLICPVHWLRIVLAKVELGPGQRRLLRSNSRFSVAMKPFAFSDEMDALYARYYESLAFDAPESVEACLFGGALYNFFDTYVMEVRDEERLIAVGVFDNGQRSIAGIMNFYDPDYRKYSLGKYLMLLKIDCARAWQKQYYYPGYVVTNYPKFDYKIWACASATEVLDASNGQWLPFSWETTAALSAAFMGDG